MVLIIEKEACWGTFVNVEFGYTQLNTARSFGDENEYATFLIVNRPLVSPYLGSTHLHHLADV